MRARKEKMKQTSNSFAIIYMMDLKGRKKPLDFPETMLHIQGYTAELHI